MLHKHASEAVDRTFRDTLCRPNNPLGGKVIVFGGDLRQYLPINPGAGRAKVVSACINRASFWPSVVRLSLLENLRLSTPNLRYHERRRRREHAVFILRVGNGTVAHPIGGFEGDVEIPPAKSYTTTDSSDLIHEVYGVAAANLGNTKYFAQRAILTPLHVNVRRLNAAFLNFVPGDKNAAARIDAVSADDDAAEWRTEFLNTVDVPSFPSHELELKIGCPNMIMRNIMTAPG